VRLLVERTLVKRLDAIAQAGGQFQRLGRGGRHRGGGGLAPAGWGAHEGGGGGLVAPAGWGEHAGHGLGSAHDANWERLALAGLRCCSCLVRE